MNIWEFLSMNPKFATWGAILLSIAVIAVVVAIGVLIVKFFFFWDLLKKAKNEADFNSLSKSIKRDVRKKRHPFIFASSVRDNDKYYKDVQELFDKGSEIQYIDYECIDNFDKIFGKYKIVVYQVHHDDIDDTVSEPLFQMLANYCAKQEKHCILLTFSRIKPEITNSFDPFYVTTVNYHSKLRETLFTLLYFTP